MFVIWRGISGGTLQLRLVVFSQTSQVLWGVGEAYGGSSLFGSRSMRSSPSFGGGINGSGGHDVILCGVFQGTVDAEGVASVVDA